jgi:enamine deaminase RidA (YjgF/YER057c/UK114 family)
VHIEERIAELGLTLPAAPAPPTVGTLPPDWIRVLGRRVLVSGHGPLLPDGMPAGPFGRVPDQVPLEVAQESARLAALAVIGTVRRAIGDLDRIASWVTVSGFVFAEPGYRHTTAVLNAFSAVVHDVFGREVGAHARTAIGAATLPLGVPVVVAAELALRD